MDIPTLAIMCVDGIGPRLYKTLVQTFGSAEQTLEQDEKTLKQIQGITNDQASAIVDKRYQRTVDIQLKWMEKYRAYLLTLGDESYPGILRQIYDPPPVLMCMGEFHHEDDVAFGVVGMRYPDDYGKKMCYKIAKGIAERNICIVSGMAKGIDAISHQAALDTGSRTIAVMGTSLERIYPAENKHLFDKIKEKGVVCTETLIGQKQVPANFIRRNRIISGLSRGVIVVQAGTTSGSLVTALNANEQNRDVFAVPGDALKGRHTGCHRLIRLGAKIVENADDVINEYPFLKERMNGQKDIFIEAARKTKLGKEEEAILNCLNKDGVHIDIIFDKCELDRAEIMKGLLGLEIKGYVQRGKGDYYVRNI
ncbi:MAG: DNA-processing protein DprA [Candidatus Marinimicrobia bacterium]|nr:DNA-processing protein DprA [Candidatus Neomarinimicrobiota bacterium]